MIDHPEMLADPGRLSADDVEGLFASQYGHATPKLDVRGAVFRDDAILLVEEASDRGWSLPGGWADVGETPSAAVEREVLEESGFRVEVALAPGFAQFKLRGRGRDVDFEIAGDVRGARAQF